MAKAPAPKEEKKKKRVPVTGFKPMTVQEHTITQKRSGRYQVVVTKGNKPVNGDAKTKILLAAKLIKKSTKKPADAPAAN